jgi:hypothetical protein
VANQSKLGTPKKGANGLWYEFEQWNMNIQFGFKHLIFHLFHLAIIGKQKGNFTCENGQMSIRLRTLSAKIQAI